MAQRGLATRRAGVLGGAARTRGFAVACALHGTRRHCERIAARLLVARLAGNTASRTMPLTVMVVVRSMFIVAIGLT